MCLYTCVRCKSRCAVAALFLSITYFISDDLRASHSCRTLAWLTRAAARARTVQGARPLRQCMACSPLCSFNWVNAHTNTICTFFRNVMALSCQVRRDFDRVDLSMRRTMRAHTAFWRCSSVACWCQVIKDLESVDFSMRRTMRAHTAFGRC